MAENTNPEASAATSGVSISDSVVAKIAFKAISGIEGIHSLGGSSRALASLRGDKGTPGVNIDLHEDGVDVDLTMTIVFGANVPKIAEACRAAVAEQIEASTGLKVRSVNVLVSDVVFPEEQAGSAG